jgi:hypothetical protein
VRPKFVADYAEMKARLDPVPIMATASEP